MAKPFGSTKIGGRKKGTPNKSTQNLTEALDALSFDVPSQLIELMPRLTAEKQADVLMGLMKYIYPSRKAIEHAVAVTQPAPPLPKYQNLTQSQLDFLVKDAAESLGYSFDETEMRMTKEFNALE